MSNLAICPDRQDIERLHLGRLSLEQAAALDEHLLACETCCQVLHELDSRDLLGETLRALGTGESAIADRVQAVMARLKEMTLPGKAVEETLVRGRDVTTDAWDLERLLDPPQAEGELGRFAGYRVLRVLGAGGMGLVLEAEDPQLRRRVALKVMQRSLAAHEENRQRFLREARATAAIEHAHIVTVHQVGEHNGLPFLAMQLLKGESLQDRVERMRVGAGFRVQDSVGNEAPSGSRGVPGAADAAFPPLPPGEGRGEGGRNQQAFGGTGEHKNSATPPHPNPLPEGEGTGRPHPLAKKGEPQRSLPLAEVLRIGREIAEALAEAHARNLIHRDIKPGNIWLEGASGWVKLVDFGLAHAAEDVHLTQTGAILGTPAYMSPEQARGETVDGRSDLYSQGAVLYKLTTGDVPFRGASTMAVLMALATETPRPPIELNPDIPPALNDLILRLLAKKPADRYESAMAVAEAIRQIETSRVGIAHHEPEFGQRADVPARRRPRWPLVAAAAAAAFLLATIVIIVRDKDGKELTRMSVKEGASAEVLTDAATSNVAPARPAGIEPATADAKILGPVFRSSSADAEQPFVVLRGGKEAARFKTWAATQAELRAGDEVEVHGNGPFRLPAIRLYGIGLKMKAAQGYQPTFVPDESVDPADRLGWIVVSKAPVVLEGCEFRQPANHLVMFKGWTDSVEIRRCRLISGHSGRDGNILAFNSRSWKVADSFFYSAWKHSVCSVVDAEKLLFENNIIFNSGDRFLSGSADAQTRYKLRLTGNTLFGWYLNAGRSEISADRNVLAGRTGILYWKSGDGSLRDWCQWTGRQNVFVARDGNSPEETKASLFTPTPVSPEDQTAAQEFFKGSQVSSSATMWPGVPWRASNAQGVRPWIAVERLNLARPKSAAAAPRIGPDWRLVGTGEAYLAALAEQGQAAVGDSPRPDALDGGAVALLGPGRPPRGFATIAQVIDAAQDGDTVELRSDGEFEGVNRREEANGKRLTLRAAPGYRPIVRGALRLAAADAWSIEGLRFNAFVDVPHLVEKHETLPNGRLLNCSFEPPAGEEATLSVSGFKADAPAYEIIGCVMPREVSFAAPDLIARNSALSTIVVPRTDGYDEARRALWLDHCVLFAFTPVSTPSLIHVQPPATVEARGTWFECRGAIVEHHGELRWQGSGNAFCLAGMEWEYARNAEPKWSCFDLSEWQARHSTDFDSWSGDAWLLDPRAWRLTERTTGYRAGPDGRDLGADVDRIPGPSGVDLSGVIPPLAKVAPALGGGIASRLPAAKLDSPPSSVGATAAAGNIPPPGDFPEPPPLEEWLKGREVLTVAQDGSGQFKTIQAALDALQAGQVVKVLDRGPYREQLNVRVLPADTGLVSEVGTSIEPPVYGVINKGSVWEAEVAHYFRQMEGFRLAGFKIASPEPSAGRYGPNTFCLNTFCCEGFVLERCWLRGTAQFHVGGHAGDGGKPACVRECLIENMLHVASRDNDDAVVLVTHNLFVGPEAMAAVGEESVYRHIGVKDNVFAGPKDGLEIHSPKHFGRLEITNNTFLGSNPIRWLYFDGNAVAAGEAIIVNNLRLRPGLLALLPGPTPAAGDLPAQTQAAVRQGWHVARNSYPRDLRLGDSDYQAGVVKFADDILGAPRLQSMVAENRDYLRPVADDPIARRGIGGEWPGYIGALPPGPAPKERDWFTRLRERWTDVGWALPTTEPKVGNAHPTIPEPPPLEEWLNGREVLTVAQDGSGQFKTIQAALDALKQHQVVKVLDRGPYQVSLKLENLPDDVGLVSDRRTVLEISAWIPEAQGSKHLAGMYFAYAAGFRLHGFTIVATKPPHGTSLAFGNCADVVVEECIIRETGPDHGKQAGAALSVQWFEGYGKRGPVWVRDSGLEGQLRIGFGGGEADGGVTLARNYLYRRGSSEAILIDVQNLPGAFVMRDNVMETRGAGLNWSCASAAREPLVMVNNSVFARSISFWGDHLPGEGLIVNNLFEVGVRFSDDPAPRAAVKDWRVGPNAYLSAPTANELLRPRPTDLSGDPKLLSRDGRQRDFLRPRADSPLASAGAGGDLPGYIGALRPGSAPKEGDSFTRLQERWYEADAAVDAVSSRQAANTPPPADIAEPPPLDEWLKDRTVLTVAQDGRGQFKTIQEALNALKPGQVVRVLDRGPYREALNVFRPPKDTGLVSDQNTEFRLTVEKDGPVKDQAGEFHAFNRASGFRLSGFVFSQVEAKQHGDYHRTVNMTNPDGVVIENCVFQQADAAAAVNIWAMFLNWDDDSAQRDRAFVRDCIFDGRLLVNLPNVVVERNWFHSDQNKPFVSAGRERSQVVFRHNILDGDVEDGIYTYDSEGTELFEVSNNTVLKGGLLVDKVRWDATMGTTVRNNLFGGSILFTSRAVHSRPEAIKLWRIGSNGFPHGPTGQTAFPRQATDMIAAADYLSGDPASRDYLRLRGGSAAATGGAGGDWPDYIGALPPGPAPKEGDWFTRLQARRAIVGWASPR